MAVHTKITVPSSNPTDAKHIIFDRNLTRVGGENEAPLSSITISITSQGGQQLSCAVDVLDFLNAVKSAFPELLLNLSS